MGGNGSGKSTLARLITGLYQPHDGVIRLDGEALDSEPGYQRLRRLFSSVFTDFHLFDQLIEAGERMRIRNGSGTGLISCRCPTRCA